MIKTLTIFTTLTTFCTICAGANAGDYGIGLGLSTLGVTVTPEYRYSDQYGFRAPIGYMSYSDDISEDGTNLKAKATIGGVGLLADYYVGSTGVRLTGGIMKPFYSVSGEGNGTSVEIEGNTYSTSEFSTEIKTTSIAPYLGLGYQYRSANNWTNSIDLGAMFNVKYSGDYSYDSSGLSAAEQGLLETDADQFLDDALSDLNKYGSVLPFVSISFSYEF